VIGWKDSSENT